MKPRFSLKLLLGLATFVTLWLGWRAQSPRVAKEFAGAIQLGDEAAADAMVRGEDDCLARFRKVDRWLVRSIEISEFRPAPGLTAWMLNQQNAEMKLHVLDREGGYGVITVDVAATPLGVSHSQDGSWESETPLLMQWLTAITE